MSELIGMAKQSTISSKSRLLKTFAHVPDDKLGWTPSGTCKSALRIAAHIGVSNYGMASALRGEPMPFNSLDELLEASAAKELAVTTREEAVKLVEDSAVHFVSTIDSLTPERLAGTIELPFGSFPVAAFMFLASSHMDGHSGQIDYLETIWGDQENYL